MMSKYTTTVSGYKADPAQRGKYPILQSVSRLGEHDEEVRAWHRWEVENYTSVRRAGICKGSTVLKMARPSGHYTSPRPGLGSIKINLRTKQSLLYTAQH